MPESLVIEATLVEQLERAASRAGLGVRFLDRRFLEVSGDPADPTDAPATYLTYRELLGRARRLARALIARGLTRGARVALVLPTGPEFYDAFFGALIAGAVPVPLYPPVRLGRLDEYHQRTAAMLVACGAELVLSDERVSRLLGRSMELAGERGVAADCLRVSALVSSEGHQRAAELPAAPAADDLALVQFSSGTTVEPKPVALTHRQLQANVVAILDQLLGSYPEDDALTHAGVSWLPLYHDMGLVGCVLVAVARPGELTLIPPELFVARPGIWLRAISRYRGTISPAPNFAFGYCAERVGDDELEGVDLSCWRAALNGAEPVTPTVLRRFVERFEPCGLRREALTPVYGLAEAALAVTFSPIHEPFSWRRFDRRALLEAGEARPLAADPRAPGSAAQPLVSLGRPLPGFSVKIAGADGAELAAGSLGRVLVRGPSVMRGYLGMPERTAAALEGGWLDTGDTGFIHDGELYLYGRQKDLVIVRGRNHAPQDIEQCLDGLSGVRIGCVAAVGVTDEAEGERLVVLVERSRGVAAPHGDDLAERVSRRISERTGLRAEVQLLAPGSLPRTSSGKIRRQEAQRQLLAGTLGPPRRVSWWMLLGELLRSRLALRRVRRRAAGDAA